MSGSSGPRPPAAVISPTFDALLHGGETADCSAQQRVCLLHTGNVTGERRDGDKPDAGAGHNITIILGLPRHDRRHEIADITTGRPSNIGVDVRLRASTPNDRPDQPPAPSQDRPVHLELVAGRLFHHRKDY